MRIRWQRSYLVERKQEYVADVPDELVEAYRADPFEHGAALDEYVCANNDPDDEDYEALDDDELIYGEPQTITLDAGTDLH